MGIPTNETVEYQIIIQAQKAIAALAELTKNAGSFDSKVKQVTATVQAASKQWGMSLQSTITTFKTYDKALADAGQSSKIFGEAGKQGWHDVGQAAKNAEPHVERFRRSIDAVRIAMGTLVAMAVFRTFNFIEETIRKSIESIKQLEVAVYQLAVAEKTLSEAGVDVSMEDFKDTIDKIKDIFSFISDIDVERMVAKIAMTAKDLKLPWAEAEKILMAIPVLAQRAGISVEQATQQVVNGLTTSGRGWKDLFVNVDANIIKQEAVSMKLVESKEAYDKLTAEQKQQVEVLALISLLNKNVADELTNQEQQLGTVTDATRTLSGVWEDFTTTLGGVLKPILVDALQALIIYIQIWKNGMVIIGVAVIEMVAAANGAFKVLDEAMHGNIRSLDDVRKAYHDTAEDIKETLYKQMFPGGVPQLELGTDLTGKAVIGFGDYFDQYTSSVDTATAATENFNDGLSEIDTTKAEEEIEKLLEDLEALDQKEINIRVEFAERQARELEDFNIEMARFEEDYQIRRRRAVEDANNDIAERQRRHRQREQDEEAKFQERMRQLREQYLFDLEDALRERDARQVLRLMRKYDMDRTNLTNEYNLRRQEEDAQNAQEIADARRQRDQRLRILDEEHRLARARKEADFALKRKRQLEDFQQELAELQKQREAKLQEAAKAIAEELGIRGEGVKDIYNLLKKYYGSGGIFDKLFDYSNRSMVARATAMLEALRQIVIAYSTAMSHIAAGGMGGGVGTTGTGSVSGGASSGSIGGRTSTGRTGSDSGVRAGSIGGRAKGGTFLATSPTTARFGEAGAELATFIPLNRPGASGGLLGASLGQSGGQVSIEVLLSPDLEARVISSTLDRAGAVVAKVVNSKR